MEIVLMLVALVAGAGLPVQAGVNSAMASHAGRPEWAALVNFSVGLVALGTWLAVTRLPPPSALALSRAPWWTWVGGFLGAFYVCSVVLVTPRLGVATTLALAVTGQMIGAVLLDHFGALGLEVRMVSATRLLGASLLVLGVLLIQRR